MLHCRNLLPDDVVEWIDAVLVLQQHKARFPALLGTGGNEGSGSYMSGFAQQVVTALIERQWDFALQPSLFDKASHNYRTKQTPGHFLPEASGGPNITTALEGNGGTNVWDYLLMLEGALLFAGAAVRRLHTTSDGALTVPFFVRPCGTGYVSSSLADEAPSAGEMWFPLWDRSSTIRELAQLLTEGRAVVGGRLARTATDFARAVANLGVDRGITEFCRYGFHQRNGKQGFAIPLSRVSVLRSPQVATSYLQDLDSWLTGFRAAATGKRKTPRAGRALRRLESAILDLCSYGRKADALAVLIALGEAEAAVAVSPRLRDQVAPLPLLKIDWLTQTCDDSPEYRLAASLASLWHRSVGPMRRHLEPVGPAAFVKGFPRWSRDGNDPAMVWGGGNLVRNLNAVLRRRIVDVQRTGGDNSQGELLAPLDGRCPASPGDIAAFIDGRVNDQRIEALLRGLMLLDWKSFKEEHRERLSGPDSPQGASPLPDATWALLKMCHLPFTLDDVPIRLTPAITMRATSGDGPGATRLAARRLRSSGLPPAVEVVPVRGDRMRRIAAALVFPIDMSTAGRLRRVVQRRKDQDEDDTTPDMRPAESA